MKFAENNMAVKELIESRNSQWLFYIQFTLQPF